jgi:hypothetical protein
LQASELHRVSPVHGVGQLEGGTIDLRGIESAEDALCSAMGERRGLSGQGAEEGGIGSLDGEASSGCTGDDASREDHCEQRIGWGGQKQMMGRGDEENWTMDGRQLGTPRTQGGDGDVLPTEEEVVVKRNIIS